MAPWQAYLYGRSLGGSSAGVQVAMELQNPETLGVIAVAVLLLFTAMMTVKSVPQGREWTVERFGRFTKVLKPGLNLIFPFADRIGRKLSMMEEVLSIPSQVVITRDNATVTADAIAFYQVVDAARAAYEVANLQAGITNLCLTNARTVIGAMDLDEVLSKRDEINQRLLSVVDQATAPWGVKVTRIEIKDLSPPSDITEAMARQMKAERFRRAEVTQADGEKQGAILRAEGAKQSAILQAEGRKEAAFRDAEARERLAQAEAKATQMVSESIEAGNVNALNYFLGQKYVDAFAQLANAPNQKFVILPMESAGLLGSIAGIAEMTREAITTQVATAGAVPRTARGQNAAGTVPNVAPPTRPAGT
jgi:regulator of protease activity HflC (stomatin/prohibitin superfamily)